MNVRNLNEGGFEALFSDESSEAFGGARFRL